MSRIFRQAALCCALAGSIASSTNAQSFVTAAQVNGTWEAKSGQFKIWALGHQILQVEFSGTFSYKSPAGPMANTGEGRGLASIEGDTAVFKPDGIADECRITLKFSHGKLLVTQNGTCGFGNRVTADGIYKRVSTHTNRNTISARAIKRLSLRRFEVRAHPRSMRMVDQP